MSNLTAVIIGATGGIGQAIANTLAKKGINLVLAGRNEDMLKEMQANLAKDYPSIKLNYLCCDLSKPESRQHFIQALTVLNMPINYYINNAGINDFALFSDQQDGMIEKMMMINVVYPLELIQNVIPLMSAVNPSQIINIGSTFGSIGYPGYVSYCASKFALRGATEALAREYCKTAVKFRYFSPRATNTAMNSPAVIQMNQQLGVKMDSPELVADELYHFLQSDQQSYQVGYLEKIFVKVNQLLPHIVSGSIEKNIYTIQHYAQLCNEK